MKIDIHGNTYRLATYFNNNFSDFCGMCQSIIFNTLLISILCIVAGAFLGDLVATFASWFVTGSMFLTYSTSIIAGIFALAVLTLIRIAPFAIFGENVLEIESINVAKEYYKSKKHKYCPTIEIC